MTYYSCAHNWEAMLTCIYVAWASGKGHNNIQLVFEPVGQYTLFDEYIHVDPDQIKAESVMNAVNQKISSHVYRELAYTGMSCEPDAMDNIYRVMLLGFAFGGQVLNMVQYKDVMRHQEIKKKVENEVCRFKELLRFHQVSPELLVAHIEPKGPVLPAVAPAFLDRMPSEHWVIVDDKHYQAVVHPKDEDYYFISLTEDELSQLLETENANDAYTDLWRVFFETIAIKERNNPRCQMNHFPIWARKHAVEFM